MTVYISASRDIVRAVDANAAILHQQVSYAVETGAWNHEPHARGWYTGTSDQLAAMTGLSPDQVRRSMAKLVDHGLMSKRKFRASQGNQTLSFRPVDPAHLADSPNGGASGESAESTSRESAESTYSQDPQQKPPLTPPLGGLEPGPSPSPPQVAADRRKAKAAADSNDLVVGWVRSLFEHWPGGRKGKADAAQRAVRSAIAEGWTMSEIQERLDTYKAWRQVYAEVWSVEAPLMHVSRFVNELRKQRTAGEELWVDTPTPAAVADRWPPPRGHSWERALAKVAGDGRRLSREDMLELDRAGLLDDDPPADALPALLAQLRSSTATQEAIHG